MRAGRSASSSVPAVPRVALVAAILATAAGLAIAFLPTIEKTPELAKNEQPQ